MKLSDDRFHHHSFIFRPKQDETVKYGALNEARWILTVCTIKNYNNNYYYIHPVPITINVQTFSKRR